MRSILVDEAQDMSTHAFALLRAVIPEERPNDLFVVGDGHQRIYRKRVVLSHAGVNIRGRGRRLRINYRTTDEIRRYAVALLEGVEIDDLDASADSTRGYRSLMHGEVPEIQVCKSFEDEVEAVAEWLQASEPSQDAPGHCRTCLGNPHLRTGATSNTSGRPSPSHRGIVEHVWVTLILAPGYCRTCPDQQHDRTGALSNMPG